MTRFPCHVCSVALLCASMHEAMHAGCTLYADVHVAIVRMPKPSDARVSLLHPSAVTLRIVQCIWVSLASALARVLLTTSWMTEPSFRNLCHCT